MKIVIAGDYCPCGRIGDKHRLGEFDYIDESIKKLIDGADYSIVNLECPIVTKDDKPIEKCGPNLKADTTALTAIKKIGFDCVTLANNHILDYGSDAAVNTASLLNQNNIDNVGVISKLGESGTILYKELTNTKIAFVNICEKEFSSATNYSAGASPLDIVRSYHHIKEAKNIADVVIVIVHGGHEHYMLPSPRMKQVYHWFIDIGADCVVNHHQHCYSGYELYDKKPIFYGLGNFCFDRNLKHLDTWFYGLLLELNIESGISFKLHPYIQCKNKAGVSVLEGKDRDNVLSRIGELNSIINNDVKLDEEFSKWCANQYEGYNRLLVTYTSRVSRFLFTKGILPFTYNKSKLLAIYNRIICDSHRDVFIQYLKHKASGNGKK